MVKKIKRYYNVQGIIDLVKYKQFVSFRYQLVTESILFIGKGNFLQFFFFGGWYGFIVDKGFVYDFQDFCKVGLYCSKGGNNGWGFKFVGDQIEVGQVVLNFWFKDWLGF